MGSVTPDMVLQYFRDVVIPEVLVRQVRGTTERRMIVDLVEEAAQTIPTDKIYRVSF